MPPNEAEGLSTLTALLPGGRVERPADPFSEYRVLLHSERLARRLNAEQRLGQSVFAYDETSGTFYEPGGPLTWIKAALRWIVGLQIGRAHSELQSLMRISYAVFCFKKQ